MRIDPTKDIHVVAHGVIVHSNDTIVPIWLQKSMIRWRYARL